MKNIYQSSEILSEEEFKKIEKIFEKSGLKKQLMGMYRISGERIIRHWVNVR